MPSLSQFRPSNTIFFGTFDLILYTVVLASSSASSICMKVIYLKINTVMHIGFKWKSAISRSERERAPPLQFFWPLLAFSNSCRESIKVIEFLSSIIHEFEKNLLARSLPEMKRTQLLVREVYTCSYLSAVERTSEWERDMDVEWIYIKNNGYRCSHKGRVVSLNSRIVVEHANVRGAWNKI